MAIFITGATGFIGNKLALTLAQSGEIIHTLCRTTSDISILDHPNIKIYYGDVTDIKSIENALDGCEYIYHLAAYARSYAKNNQLYYKINVDGVNNVCDAAIRTGIKKVVVTSTVVTFGPTGKKPENESFKRNTNQYYTIYEHSKILAEKKVEEYLQKGLPVTIVNPTRVFGPGLMNESNSVTILFNMYLKGKMRTILSDGKALGNYGFVDDIVAGHLLAMEKGRIGEKYILGGDNVSYNELFEIVADISGKKYFQFKIPLIIALGFSYIEKLRAKNTNHYPLIVPGWVRTFALDWTFSSRKAELELGYKYTPIREAIRQTIMWLMDKKTKNNL